MYDILIVGGGVAGLQVAAELAKRKINVCLLEKYPKLGGRAATYRGPGDIQFEIGAGRIFHAHKRVSELVRRYKLHTFPISSTSNFEHAPNNFTEVFEPLRKLCEEIPKEELAKHKIGTIVPKSMHHILKMYPYTAELHVLRADLALQLFEKQEPMASNGTSDFYGIVEGIDALATGLAAEAKKAGAILKTRHRAHDIKRTKDGLFEVKGDYGKKAEAKPFLYTAKRIVIATCRCSLGDFSILKGAPLLKQLATSALLRIYAIYPYSDKVWFHDLPKTVTAGKLRYIIPINPKKGLIMISYTDGPDTDYWRALEGDKLRAEIQKEVKALFPDRTIPEPTFLEKYDWPSGCTYWLPGTYDVAEASAAAHNPAENVYVCGESVSMQQTWIEGALESAETLLKILPSK